MDRFTKQCTRLGTTKGWRYFSFSLRGKEELLVVVHSPRDGDTTFLLAGYEKYGRPYVWVRPSPFAWLQLGRSFARD